MVSVYVSYAWKDEEQSRLVDKLEEACAARKIDLLRDKEQVPYAGSIRAFMGRVGKGKHVVVVLSAAYLKSRYCMYELREIYRNGSFRERVLPIILHGTPIEDPEERVAYLEHWEAKGTSLKARLSKVDRANTKDLNKAVDDYDDFRRLMAKWLGSLVDMNALSDELLVATDFAPLLDKVMHQTAGSGAERPELDRQEDEDFLATVKARIREILAELPPSFAERLRKQASEFRLSVTDDLVEDLCAGKLEVVLDDVLRPATESALPRGSAQEIRQSAVWEAAKSLLLWLSVLAVDPDWVRKHHETANHGESPLEVFVKTTGCLEIVSARYRQTRPAFHSPRQGFDLLGEGAIRLSPLETGWNDDRAVQQIMLDVAAHLGGAEWTDTTAVKKDLLAEWLDDTLYYRAKHKLHNDYVAVPPGDKSPLQRRDFYELLKKNLDSLAVIHMKAGDEETALLVDKESRLITIIRGFLNMPDDLAKRR